MKDRFIQFYMALAEQCAQMSYATRLKVGCIIVKDDNIISHSWNGTPKDWDNTAETFEPVIENNIIKIISKTKPETMHSEEHCIIKLAKSGFSSNNATLFCTHLPCLHCSRLIYGAGIKEVYYRDVYRDLTGKEFLEKCNIKIFQVSPN